MTQTIYFSDKVNLVHLFIFVSIVTQKCTHSGGKPRQEHRAMELCQFKPIEDLIKTPQCHKTKASIWLKIKVKKTLINQKEKQMQETK